MLQFLNKMPKQQEPDTGGVGHLRYTHGRRPIYRLPPIEGKIIDPGGKKTKRKHAMGPKMPLGIRPVTHGSDLRDLLHSTHTKDTVDRIKVGSNFNHAANLFSNDFHAGGMGAVRAAYHGGNKFKVDHSKQKFTYQNHMGTQVKVPAGWKVDSFGSAYDPTKPHAM